MTLIPHIEAGALGAWLKVRIKGVWRRIRERWAARSQPDKADSLQTKLDALQAKYAKGREV